MKKVFIFLLFLFTIIFPQNIKILFLGIVPGGAPEFEKRFENQLRKEITLLTDTDIADFNDIEYLKRKTDFFDSPILSRSFIQSLNNISNPNAKILVIWGVINEFNIKPKRYLLFGARAIGLLSMELTMYSLNFKEYIYYGEVECYSSELKPPIFFNDVNKHINIFASDRAKIIKELNRQAVSKSIAIIKSVTTNFRLNGDLNSNSDKIKGKKVPSVSELFDIPSVEKPNIINKK